MATKAGMYSATYEIFTVPVARENTDRAKILSDCRIRCCTRWENICYSPAGSSVLGKTVPRSRVPPSGTKDFWLWAMMLYFWASENFVLGFAIIKFNGDISNVESKF